MRTTEAHRDRNGRLVMDCNSEAQALGHAAERLRLAERLFEADRRLDGYDR